MNIDKYCTEPVSIQPFTGDGSMGRTLGDPVTVLVDIDQTRKLVRDMTGFEVTAESTLYLQPFYNGQDASLAFPPESVVTYRGRSARVITAKPFKRFGVLKFVELTTT